MADNMLSAVLQVVIDKAATFLQQQLVGAPSELKRRMLKLQRTLAIIKCMIADAEKRVRRSGNSGLRTWFVHLRDAVYDAEDVFDMLEYERLKEKVMKATTAGSLRYAVMKRNPINSSEDIFIEKIIEIQENFDHLLSMANYFKLEMVEEVLRPANNDVSQGRITSPDRFADDENFLGRENDKKNIIKLLLDATVPIPVIAIVGMGGHGKTTLAQIIYHSEEVENHFEEKIWVCVSDDFRVERIFQDILKSLKAKRESIENTLKIETSLNDSHDAKGKSLKRNMSMQNQRTKQESKMMETSRRDLENPREQVHGILRGKMCLFVLDDIWGIEKWNDLVSELDCKNGSKILLTTRNQKIASTLSTLNPINLDELSDEDTETLLKRHAFSRSSNVESSHREQLEKIGKDIAKKLNGSPLACKTIGRILSTEFSEEHWNNILGSEIWDIPQQEGDIMPALQLSYEHLPSHLKPCFAFCSAFPKDFQYSKQEIVGMWIALGLVQHSGGGKKLLEDIGHKYMNDLLDMSMLQPCKDDFNAFSMHDLVHDMATIVSKEESLLIHGDFTSGRMPNSIKNLTIYTNGLENWDFLKNYTNISYLRSLILIDNLNPSLDTIELPKELYEFLRKSLPKAKSLRILKLSDYYIDKIPNWLENLKCLRYLDVYNNDSKTLVSYMTRLYHLQVLSLKGHHIWVDKFLQSWRVPDGMQNLVSLRHIYPELDLHFQFKVVGENILKSLQELSIEWSGVDNEIRMLRNMTQIQSLGIEVRREIKGVVAGLSHMKHLKKLQVSWSYMPGEAVEMHTEFLEVLRPHVSIEILILMDYIGEKGPSWLENGVEYKNLERICLINCDKWKVLPPLGRLARLRYLEIVNMKSLTKIDPNFFGQVQAGSRRDICMSSITLKKCPELGNFLPWMPATVTDLILEECPKIGKNESLPEGWLSRALKTLIVKNCGGFGDIVEDTLLENLVHLERLELDGCNNITSLPQGCSTHLRYLALKSCKSMESVPIVAMKSLKEMKLESCEKLSGTLVEGLQGLPNLEALRISKCPILEANLATDHVVLPSSLKVEYLFLYCAASTSSSADNASSDVEVGRDGIARCSIDSKQLKKCLQLFGNNITSVEVLTIFGFEDLESFDADMEDTLANFSSLKWLTLYSLPVLRSLPGRLCALSSLRDLSIYSCAELCALPDNGLPQSLSELEISGCPKLGKQLWAERHRVSGVETVVVDGRSLNSVYGRVYSFFQSNMAVKVARRGKTGSQKRQ